MLTVAAEAPRPLRTPIDRYVLDYRQMNEGSALSAADLRANVGIFANAEAGRMHCAVMLVEEIIKRHEQRVFVVSTDTAWNGLASLKTRNRMKFVTFGRNVGGLTISENDGGVIARQILGSGGSAICQIGHLTEDGATAQFLSDFFKTMNDEHPFPFTVALDVAQSLFPRRRFGKDGPAVRQMTNFASNGHHRGASILATATSPAEIPVEIRNELATKFFGRATEPNQQTAIEAVIHSQRIYSREAFKVGYGAAFQQDHQYFIMPGGLPHPDRLLYNPLTDSSSDAGPGGREPHIPPSYENIVRAILASRKDGALGDEKGKVRKKKKRKAKSTASSPRRWHINSVESIMRRRGMAEHAMGPTIGHAVLSYETSGEVPAISRLDPFTVVARIERSHAITKAARWTMRFRDRKNDFDVRSIASTSILGAAYAIAIESDEVAAERYFSDVLTGQNTIVRILKDMDDLPRSTARLKALLDGFQASIKERPDNIIPMPVRFRKTHAANSGNRQAA